MMIPKSIFFPKELMAIKYNGKVIPLHQQNKHTHELLETGANCQVFAYHILRLNGYNVPSFRSSELWLDTEYSKSINLDFQPLDILFFNRTKKPFGAHLAVFLDKNSVIHLSKSIGKPIIWTIEEFLKLEKYKVLIGGKRFFNK